jgi:eukaryotic-like serine/threonine-protein kinase
MDVDRMRRVDAVLDAVLTREPTQWPALLDEACSGDAELRREVERLLERLDTASRFLDSPPGAIAAALIAETREAERGLSADSFAGRRIGAYRIDREVGRGGMSRVFLADRADGEFEQQVALKLLRPGLDSDLDLARLRAERQILASLNHPNIARLLDGGVTEEGLPYLVMEYIDGQPLDRHCADWDLSVRQRLELFRSVAEATEYAHRNLVVHRDLKPSNILVTATGTVKLLDFGLAKLLQSDSPTAMPATRAGHGWMTPEYAAPEQIRGTGVTTVTDVYQLGVVLYELLAGEPPFHHVDRDQLRAAVLAGAPPPIGERAGLAGLAPGFAALVMQCLARDPAARPESADDVLYQLEQVAAGAAVPDGNPYRGLAPFEAVQRGVFFGRDAEIAALVDLVRREPLVVVTGDSGIGKSSLCRAGVLPAIERGALGDRRTWTTRTTTLGRRPIAALADLLAIEPRVLADSEPHLLASAIGRHLDRAPDRGLLLFIDQLEELVTQAPADQLGQASAILAALGEGIPGVKAVFALRGDFLTRVAAAPNLRGPMTRGLYLVRGLSPDDAREVIVGPARARGVAFESREMVDALVESVADRPAALPLLQFALSELWARRDPERAIIPARALDEIGGVAGALASHADRVITALAAPERRAARRLALALVTPEGTRAARTRDELTGDEPTATAALEALVSGRLVAARDVSDGPPVYELAHESLLAAWGTLRGWLDDIAGQRGIRTRLSAAAGEWQRLGRRGDLLWRRAQLAEAAALDELAPVDRAFLTASRRAGRLRRALAIASVAAIPLAAGAVWYGIERRDAERRELRVAEQLATAEAELREIEAAVARARDTQRAAIDRFEHQHDDGEDRWSDAQTEFSLARTRLRQATAQLEETLLVSGNRPSVRRLTAATILRELELAEELGDTARIDELRERLERYDDGTQLARWRRATPVVLAARSATRIEIARYARQPDGLMLLSAPVISRDADRVSIELPPGSYRSSMHAPGIDPVALPFVVERTPLELDVALPAPGQVPDGFVYVPAGAFLTGSKHDETFRRDVMKSRPRYRTSTPAFLIKRHEVTFDEWMDYLNALPPAELRERQRRAPGGAPQTARLGGGGRIPFTLILQATAMPLKAAEGEPLRYPTRDRRAEVRWENLPATGISYTHAVDYARWLADIGRVPRARLCREIEWERAAKGADSRDYPHGDRLLPDDANIDVTYGRVPTSFGPDEVGQYAISNSPFGIADMAGNIAEWVLPRDALPDRELTQGIIHGGSWYWEAPVAIIDNRSPMEVTADNALIGIRLCADP